MQRPWHTSSVTLIDRLFWKKPNLTIVNVRRFRFRVP